MLLGLAKPTAGTLKVAGAAPGSAESLAKLGAIVETPAFWPYLTGKDNLRLLTRYCGQDESRVSIVLDEVELSSRGDSKFSTYSLGMKQRLGVAAALLKDPQLLILDEPTNGLDPQGMADFRAMIKRLGKGDRTVLLSSHLLTEVEQICTRVGVINKGKMVFEGTISDLRGGTQISLRADPPEKARATLQQMFPDQQITSDNGALMLPVDQAQAPAIARKLVEAGVDILELKPSERSLEEVFIELTEAEKGR
jgi:ABC-2 type transport system ATP-binding protein